MKQLTLVAVLAAALAILVTRHALSFQTQPVASIALPPPGSVVQLYTGCNNIALTFPNGTPSQAVMAAVHPPSSIESMWRHDAAQNRFEGFSPLVHQVSDLLTVNFLDAAWLCVVAAATPPTVPTGTAAAPSETPTPPASPPTATPLPAPTANAGLSFETEDWIFVAPSSLGTREDLELGAHMVQICTNEIKALIGHRPSNVPKFKMEWVIDGGQVSNAGPTGVVNHVPSADWELVTEDSREFRETLVATNSCFGPHEITHVLTWESWGPAWANEGFAEFTDRLYDGSDFTCDGDGYASSGEHHPYADLSPFSYSTETYNTAACFWWEIQQIGGNPAIREILASMRADPPDSTKAFIVGHVNAVLATDLRPIAERYGFSVTELY
jgi:hypothetical protein